MTSPATDPRAARSREAILAAAHLIGPLVYRTTLQAAPVPDRLLTAVIDAVAPRRQPGLAPAPGATAQAG